MDRESASNEVLQKEGSDYSYEKVHTTEHKFGMVGMSRLVHSHILRLMLEVRNHRE